MHVDPQPTQRPTKQWSTVEDGLIRPPDALELIVCDHCNLTCRQCNHASPIQPKWNVDPEDAFRELSTLARFYRPRRVKLLGGEPLLNPKLPEIIFATKRSNITPHVLLITNGVLLQRLPLESWHDLDEVEITRYPHSGLTDEVVDWAIARAKETRTKLTLTSLTDFRHTLSRVPNEDTELVAKIFAACKLVSIWGCHALYRGRLYRCPPSMYVHTFGRIERAEGMPLDDAPRFRERLLAYLNGDTPLESCRHCVGTCGKKVAHTMPTRTEWLVDLELPPAALLDEELLESALVELSILDDCRVVVGEHPVPEPLVAARRRTLASRMIETFWRRSAS
jgi:organic radical activating enzyme